MMTTIGNHNGKWQLEYNGRLMATKRTMFLTSMVTCTLSDK